MLLTEEIYQSLFQAVLTGEFKPGERFLTEQEAMARFGASRITIRRAFARLEENRIITRRTKVGGVVNSTFGAATGALRTVGVLAPIRDPFAREFLHTLCEESARRDAVTALEPAESGAEQNRAVMRLALHGVRDLVVWGIDRTLDFDLFLRLRILGVNLVFFDRIHPGTIADYVGLDNAEAFRRLTAIAQKQNIKQIYFADPSGLDIDSNRERRDCCRTACRGNNIAFSTEFPAVFPARSAIFAVNDPAALACCKYNVPVFSIDGTPEAEKAGIVSLRQPMAELAKACFRSLREQRRLGSRWRAQEYRLPAESLKK